MRHTCTQSASNEGSQNKYKLTTNAHRQEATNAVKLLIASKIKVFVYILYVCILCIFIMYKYKHVYVYI